jgi:heme/copper-type cytochrome/quinol oxidase subunit 3
MTNLEKMSTPGFLFHYILIAYVWQCIFYFLLGRHLHSWKDLPWCSLPMSIFFYMEAFNLYSKTVFEDKVMLRTGISFLMGLNFLICLIPNWRELNKSGKKAKKGTKGTEYFETTNTLQNSETDTEEEQSPEKTEK